jgi:HD-GYP domain-containing protein (c-di-GMP phosphodiesterase class II)
MKEHVSQAETYLHFVPKQCLPLFIDAATKHHENMNGTGYPYGLKGDSIPHVARVIHSAESFVSLTSKRLYHRIRDTQSAIAELKRQPGIYDGEVIDALEKVV